MIKTAIQSLKSVALDVSC